MDTKLRQKANNNLEKGFFKLMNSIRNKLSHYKVFYGKFISNRNEKTKTLMNKPVYLDLSKTIMYKVRYDYVKPKYSKTLYYGQRQLHCSCKSR